MTGETGAMVKKIRQVIRTESTEGIVGCKGPAGRGAVVLQWAGSVTEKRLHMVGGMRIM